MSAKNLSATGNAINKLVPNPHVVLNAYYQNVKNKNAANVKRAKRANM